MVTDDVLVVIGVGGMGHAIARRGGPGKTVLLADANESTLHAAAETMTATATTFWVNRSMSRGRNR